MTSTRPKAFLAQPAADNIELRLEDSIASATKALCALQRPDGHFVFELEADATIPAEYVLMRHYRGEPINAPLEAKIARYLRRIQSAEGGWPLFHAGASDVSASVKADFALKMIGERIDAPHMVRARNWILARGGAAYSNVFTRNLLALYGQVPWRAVPVMPVEIMLLPRWFPFHLDKVSYWARTVLVPLMVLNALKPRARNPRGIGIAELFTTPPEDVQHWPKGAHQTWPWAQMFGGIDRILRGSELTFPRTVRARAIDKAVKFVRERLNGEDGLGAIFPAMVNSLLMFDALGNADGDVDVRTARTSIDKLLVVKEDEAYCQPCLSPVWDTALAVHALLEAGSANAEQRVLSCLEWLRPLQVLETAGDWAATRPNVRPGGWAFQYANPHYPDLDDTAVVIIAMDRASARMPDETRGAFDKAIAYLLSTQEKDGSWYGRWGMNYIYGTWSVLCGLNAAGVDAASAEVRKAVQWLQSIQNPDGGWGESGESHKLDYRGHEPAPSTASQTAWALLGLMAASEIDHPSVEKGVDYLLAAQRENGFWEEQSFTATGFPRVFYLRYHGYAKFFPLWALARYRNLRAANTTSVLAGM